MPAATHTVNFLNRISILIPSERPGEPAARLAMYGSAGCSDSLSFSCMV